MKYRHCEQSGVEASAEIQAAARRVLEENRRLRQMLKQYGIPEDQTDGVAHSPADSSVANDLETLLSAPRPCGDTASMSSNDYPAQMMPLPAPIPVLRQENRTAQPRLLPLYSGNHTPSTQVSNTTTHNHYHAHLSAGSAPPPQPNRPVRVIPCGTPTPNHPSATSNNATGTTSCLQAAAIIRSIRPSVGYELEAELGCRSSEDECVVANSHIFQEMDRYSGDV